MHPISLNLSARERRDMERAVADEVERREQSRRAGDPEPGGSKPPEKKAEGVSWQVAAIIITMLIAAWTLLYSNMKEDIKALDAKTESNRLTTTSLQNTVTEIKTLMQAKVATENDTNAIVRAMKEEQDRINHRKR